MSQLYCLSLIINDIDPEYSLGLKELERQRTIGRLQSEGLMGLQQELELPVLPGRLAVISAEDAAGYRDFTRHLEENPYGFSFDVTLFPALMQGAECPKSVISALDAVLDSGESYDAVLVLRGGGARLDLACFDDYEMAAVIAQFPIPVLTAIGHDQDHHVCDMVAHSYFKTPTALADGIISMFEDEDVRISSLQTRLKIASVGRIAAAEALIEALGKRVAGGFSMKISAMDSALQMLRTRIQAADPRRVLERGYALVLDGGGRVLKTASGKGAGDKVSVMFADGTLRCTVDEAVE